MIRNKYDESGSGLFSKAGRAITQKIPVLAKLKTSKEKEKKKFSFQQFSSIKITYPKRKVSIKKQPFTKSLSRERRNSALQPFEKKPCIGHYNLKQNRRKALKVWNILDVYQKQCKNKEFVKSRRCTMDSQNLIQQYSSQNKFSVLNQIPGFIDMRRMAGRDLKFSHSVLNTVDSDQLEQSIQDAKMRNSFLTTTFFKTTSNFAKQLSRQKAQKKKYSTNLNYDFSEQYIKRSLGKVGPKFEKLLSRKGPERKLFTEATTHYDFQQNVWNKNSLIYPNTKKNVISYDRMRDRVTVI